MRWMLDTNIVIALMRGTSRRLDRRIVSKSPGQVGVSSISLAELRFGVAQSARSAENESVLDEFMRPLEVAAFDRDAAVAYGPLRHQLVALGTPIGPLDTLIAAHALALDVTLVTHNTKEFRRVKGLHVEDWLAA
jgi:tRNA(fMet)-specific endonuclease VapC